MNRILIFLCGFFLSNQGSAQPYALIDTARITHFANPYDVQSIRIDSIFPGATESVLVNYKVVDYMNTQGSMCVSTIGDSWLGKRVVVRNNGDYLFINASDDSMLVRSLAVLNDSWILADSAGCSLEARIVSIQQTSVLGNVDSVKTAILQMRDSTGATMNSSYNGLTLSWSKQHGMVTSLDFLHFPLYPYTYSLAGFNNPQTGKRDIDAREIFDFAVGDTFQYRIYTPSGPGWDFEWQELSILSKSIYADSVLYTASQLWHREAVWGGSFTTWDTVVMLFKWQELEGFGKLTYEFSSNDSAMLELHGLHVFPYHGYFERLDSTLFNGHSGKSLRSYFWYDATNHCLTTMFRPASWCIYQDYNYAEGLGLVEIYESMSCYSKEMVYYSKGNETWGTPLNWGVILGTQQPVQKKLSVFPNPFDTRLHVDAGNEEILSMELFDAAGRSVANTEQASSQAVLEVNGLSPGFYLLRVTIPGKELHFKVVRE